jgi:hypothetical protein
LFWLFETVTMDLTSLVSKDAERAFERIEKNAKARPVPRR